MKLILILILFCFPIFSKAAVEVRFFSFVNVKNGEKIPVFKNYPKERRYHVAIWINGYWYQYMPRGLLRTVEIILPDRIGLQLKSGMTIQLFQESFINTNLFLNDPNLSHYEHTKFDYLSTWCDPYSYHCSKFMGQILGIAPIKPKHLASEGFFYPVEENLSPDDIFEILSKTEGWFRPKMNKVMKCSKVIKNK